MKHQNILSILFDTLKVRYTTSYLSKLYNEHPHKDSLYGIVDMLNEYGVESTGVEVENKTQDIFSLSIPFIALAGDDFVTVTKISKKNISFFKNENMFTKFYP